MTDPTETQLIEMEQRARWLMDGVEIQRRELERREESPNPRNRPTRFDHSRIDTQEVIARDVLCLVSWVRQKEKRGAGGCCCLPRGE
jgi:hypothetical protein